MSHLNRVFCFVSTAIVAVVLAIPAIAQPALSGVAVSPDGATVVCAGANRVIYLLDAESLDVRDRIYIGSTVNEIFFSKDGSTLMVANNDQGWLTFFNTNDWTQTTRLEQVVDFAVAGLSDEVVVVDRPKRVDDKYISDVRIVSLTTGKTKIQNPVEGSIHSIGAAADGSQFAIMTKGEQNESEEKQNVPKDVKGSWERNEFRQRHDGRTCEVIWLDSELKESSRTNSWYTNQSVCKIAIVGNELHALNQYNVNCRVDDKGQVNAYELPLWPMGLGFSLDQSMVTGGSDRKGVIGKLGTDTFIEFEIPAHEKVDYERFSGMAFSSNGNVFCTTNAFRIAKIDPTGKLLIVKEVF